MELGKGNYLLIYQTALLCHLNYDSFKQSHFKIKFHIFIKLFGKSRYINIKKSYQLKVYKKLLKKSTL